MPSITTSGALTVCGTIKDDSMKKLFTLTLFLLCLASTLVAHASEPTGSAPEAGKSYYLYNVEKGQYLSVASDGTLTLGSPYLEVTLKQPTSTTTADASFYTIEANSKKVIAALWQTPLLGDNKQGYYDQWQISAVSGKTDVYTLACRNRESGSTMYIYWSDAFGRLTTGFLKIWSSFANGQWKLVSPSDIESQVITLNETAESYTQPTVSASGGAEVHLYRTFSANCWNSLCVPFDIDNAQLKAQFGDDVKVAELTSVTSTSFNFTSCTNVEAGKPYLVYIPTAETTPDYYTFKGVTSFASQPSNVTVSDGNESVTFKGYFCKGTAPKSAYVLRKNQVYHLVSDMSAEGFRAVLIQETTQSGSKVFNTWSLDGATTGIGNINGATTTSFDVYSVGGQKVKTNTSTTDDLPQGVYIVNGKKITK